MNQLARRVRRRSRRRTPSASEHGQATVELALLLPVVMVLLLGVVQVALVVRDHILVVHAAREAARVEAVDHRPDAARHATVSSSSRLDPRRLRVDVGPRGEPGSPVRVQIRYRSRTDVPIIGPLMGDVELRAEATMRVER